MNATETCFSVIISFPQCACVALVCTVLCLSERLSFSLQLRL